MIALPLLCGGCSTVPVEPHPVAHVVLMWLKRPDQAGDRAQLVRAAHSLQMMPGVVRVKTGRELPPMNREVDQSFDLAAVITFRDQAALQRYEGDARHRAERYLAPLVRRYAIYNIDAR